jgi:hypothetical protein
MSSTYRFFDVTFNWFAKDNADRRVVQNVVARSKAEALRLFDAHVNNSIYIDEATSTHSISPSAIEIGPATKDQYEDFLLNTIRLDKRFASDYPGFTHPSASTRKK